MSISDSYLCSHSDFRVRYSRAEMEHVQDVKKGSPSAIHDVCGRTKIAPPAGPLGNRHWKQRAGHSQLSISSKYFTTKGGASACYVNIGNERVQLVLVNPSTNSNTKTIHMNKCNHMIAHGRLAHPNDEYYDIMLIHNMIDGIQSLGAFDRIVGTPCHDCPHGHAHARPVEHVSKRIPSGPGECVHMDVGGPMPVRGLNDELYFNMAKCKYLGHRIIYFMKTKDEIVETVRQYILETRMRDKEVYCEYKLDLIVTDSDKLYMSAAFSKLESEHNIRHWFASPYTHAQAGGIESDMRVIGENAIIVIRSSGFPLCMWPYAYSYVVWGKNRSYTKQHFQTDHKYKTPHERRFNIKPVLSEMVVFGAKCFVYIDRASRLKMQDHCWVGYFCGYPFNSKAYLVYDPARMNVYVRYHVLFDERVVYGDEIGGRKRDKRGAWE